MHSEASVAALASCYLPVHTVTLDMNGTTNDFDISRASKINLIFIKVALQLLIEKLYQKHYSCDTISDSGVNDVIPRSDERKLHVNLLPIWKGQRKQGVRYGPAILNAMVHELSNSENIVTNYYENDPLNEIDGASEEDYTSHMNQLSQKLLANLSDLKSGDTVLNLGGDHSVSMATVPKMFQLHPDLRVLWIDAHADINTPATTESGIWYKLHHFAAVPVGAHSRLR